MYNLQRYSSALLVLLLHFKTSIGLPVELQPAVAQPRLSLSLATPLSIFFGDSSLPVVAARSLNITDSNPSLQSGFEYPLNENASNAAAPGSRAAFSGSPVPSEVEARSALNLDAEPASVPVLAPNPSDPVQRSAFNVNQRPLNASLSVSNNDPPPPIYRSEFENIPVNSTVEEPFLNVGSSLSEFAVQSANGTGVEVRSFDLDALNKTNNAPASADLRKKRYEGTDDTIASSGMEKTLPISNRYINTAPLSTNPNGANSVVLRCIKV